MAELVLEIGFEEMPARWLPGLADQLLERFGEAATRELLPPTGLAAYWTPRRLALTGEVAGRQADRAEQVWGPALKVARDATSGWTAAALGFARKNAIAVEALQTGPKDPSKPDEVHLLFVRKTAGRPAAEVLPAAVAAALRGLAFPKRMSWDAWLQDGKGALPFGRPIRWLLLLLDGTAVPFEIHALDQGVMGPVVVSSSHATRGHRFLPRGQGGRPVAVRSFAELRRALAERFVILDPAERLARIDAGLREAAGAGFDDHSLREEWRDLVEYPTVVTGRVPGEFRALPAEVLETVLVHHQKYIPLRDAGGSVDRFAAVINGDGAAAAGIVRGMERVVVARLRDASFFVAEDRKRRLADRVDDLGGVTFHQGLGSYGDKALRLVRLVEAMGGMGLLDPVRLRHAREAARLAKADLTTLMVREFPELQGVMGGLYLEAEDAPREVATAVRWHYHPVAVEEDAPPRAAFAGRDARIFAAVSLADKLDTLAGYFGIGESPTGSRDPFGLRRAGQGAMRVVLDFWRPRPGEPHPDLQQLAAAAIAGYGGTLKQPAETTATALELFLLDRLEYVFGVRGFSPDEVASVAHAPDPDQTPTGGRRRLRALADPLDGALRLAALQKVRREAPEAFEHLASAFKRAKNILAQQPGPDVVDPSLFESDAERGLFRAVEAAVAVGGDEESRLRSLAGLRGPVDRFFDDVLVMAEDPRQRGNRLALLRRTLSLFYRIADLSKLGGSS